MGQTPPIENHKGTPEDQKLQHNRQRVVNKEMADMGQGNVLWYELRQSRGKVFFRRFFTTSTTK